MVGGLIGSAVGSCDAIISIFLMVEGGDSLGPLPSLKGAFHGEKGGNVLVFPGTMERVGTRRARSVLIHICSMCSEGLYCGVFSIKACCENRVGAPEEGERRERKMEEERSKKGGTNSLLSIVCDDKELVQIEKGGLFP
jgi:hypothetical protein